MSQLLIKKKKNNPLFVSYNAAHGLLKNIQWCHFYKCCNEIQQCKHTVAGCMDVQKKANHCKSAAAIICMGVRVQPVLDRIIESTLPNMATEKLHGQ